jgi:hypothetical protein
MRSITRLLSFLAVYGLATASAFQVHSLIQSKPTLSRIPPPRGQSLQGQGLPNDMVMYTDMYSVPLLLMTALGVGFAAQSFINQMLKGDDGLGAFLSDGSGYNRSGFKSSRGPKETKKDPLPWLKLPELDFVEVAGQDKFRTETQVLNQLERLRLDLNEAVEQGNLEEAEAVRKELENLMNTYDIEYK